MPTAVFGLVLSCRFQLGNGVSGIDVAKRVHALGFKQISITFGDQSIDLKEIPFVKGVLGKGFPVVQ